jgi:hypothetical protein
VYDTMKSNEKKKYFENERTIPGMGRGRGRG